MALEGESATSQSQFPPNRRAYPRLAVFQVAELMRAPPVASVVCWKRSGTEDGSSWLLCFFRHAADAEWEGSEGTCLAFNSAEPPWRALLQGYGAINRTETRLRNLEMSTCTFFPAARGKEMAFHLLSAKLFQRGLRLLTSGTPRKTCSSFQLLSSSSCSALTPAFPLPPDGAGSTAAGGEGWNPARSHRAKQH